MSIGRKYVAAINTGSWSTPTWSNLGFVKEPNPTLSRQMAANSDRGKDWQQNSPGLKTLSVDVTTSDRQVDQTDWTNIRDSWLNGTLVDIVVADGDPTTTGSQGPRAEFYVSEMSRSEPEEGQPTYSFTLVNGDGDNDPEWFEAA